MRSSKARPSMGRGSVIGDSIDEAAEARCGTMRACG
jgi:hypothetical protein